MDHRTKCKFVVTVFCIDYWYYGTPSIYSSVHTCSKRNCSQSLRWHFVERMLLNAPGICLCLSARIDQQPLILRIPLGTHVFQNCFVRAQLRPGGHDTLPAKPIDVSAFSYSKRTAHQSPLSFLKRGTGNGGTVIPYGSGQQDASSSREATKGAGTTRAAARSAAVVKKTKLRDFQVTKRTTQGGAASAAKRLYPAENHPLIFVHQREACNLRNTGSHSWKRETLSKFSSGRICTSSCLVYIPLRTMDKLAQTMVHILRADGRQIVIAQPTSR